MSNTIQELLEDRYYTEDEHTWEELCHRVVDYLFGDDDYMGISKKEYYELMYSKKFIPSSPVMMNAGLSTPMLCSCFVLPVEDSIDSIMQSLSDTVHIQKYGGGVGLNFSHIRPYGSKVSSTGGMASGPVSFMQMWNTAMDVVKQGGKRQGALMGVLNVEHPDLDRFLNAKEKEGELTNFNISVGLSEDFMNKVTATGIEEQDINARNTLRKIAEHAWSNGEPGVLFLDNINKHSAYKETIEATNPCGEIPIPSYGACCLGSMDIAKYTTFAPMNSELDAYNKVLTYIDYKQFKRDCVLATYFLNRIVEKSWWPTKSIADFENKYYPLGLGLMGLADALIKLNIGYGTQEGLDATDWILKFEFMAAYTASIAMYSMLGVDNATLMSIAPTGTISMIADTSYSIEPYFSYSFTKVVDAGVFNYNADIVKAYCDFHNIELSKDDLYTIQGTGSLQYCNVPDKMKEVFVTAMELSPKQHLDMQSVVQNRVDNAVSKTINLPFDATVDDVYNLIVKAHQQGIKGLTVYRNNSRSEQVLNVGCPTGTCDV